MGRHLESADTDGNRLFLRHRDLIEELTTKLCQRKRLSAPEADDFSSWMRVRLLDDDGAIFRKYAGRSTWRAYLAVVISNLLKDYRDRRWGRWRASAEARRLGPAVIRLETLVRRDQVPVRVATEILRSQGVAITDSEAFRVLDRLPRRNKPFVESVESIPDLEGGERPDAQLLEAEKEAARSGASKALREVLDGLPAEDLAILKLRYWDGLTVAEVARTLGLKQRPLYRRFERLLSQLRGLFEDLGLRADELGEWME